MEVATQMEEIIVLLEKSTKTEDDRNTRYETVLRDLATTNDKVQEITRTIAGTRTELGTAVAKIESFGQRFPWHMARIFAVSFGIFWIICGAAWFNWNTIERDRAIQYQSIALDLDKYFLQNYKGFNEGQRMAIDMIYHKRGALGPTLRR